MKNLIIFLLLASGMPVFAQAPNLKAYVFGWENEGLDSYTYTYSGSRGSDMKTKTYLYDTSIAYMPYNTTSGFTYTYARNYDGSNRLTYERLFAQYTSSPIKEYPRHYYIYNTGGRLDSMIIKRYDSTTAAWFSTEIETYQYDVSGNLTEKKSVNRDYPADTFLSSKRYVYEYDVNNNNTLVHYMRWNDIAKQWSNMTLHRYTYDTGNRVDTFWEYNIWYQNKWKDSTQGQLSYVLNTSGLIDHSIRSIYDFVTKTWSIKGISYFFYDTNGNMLSDSIVSYGVYPSQYQLHFKKVCTYNSYNQPLTVRNWKWDEVLKTWTIDPDYRHQRYPENYYYYPGTAVNHTEEDNQQKISLFPNPATDYVTIAILWDKPQVFSVSISDIGGRFIKHWEEKPVQQYSKMVPLHGMPAGQYFIRINGSEESISKPFVITSQ